MTIHLNNPANIEINNNQLEIQDDGNPVGLDIKTINFGFNLIATADGYGTATIDAYSSVSFAAPITNLTATTSNQEGSLSTFSRSDHVHDITTGSPSTLLPEQGNTEGSLTPLARADHIHDIPTAIVLAVGPSNVKGVANSFARSDHVHQGVKSIDANGGTDRFGDITLQQGTGITITDSGGGIFTITSNSPTPGLHAPTHLPNGSDPLTTAAPVTLNPDQSNAVGSANSFARSDHIHNVPADVAVDIGTTNQEGASTSFARANHVHQGVHSVSSNGGTDRFGDIDLIAGTNMSITDNANGSFTLNSILPVISKKTTLYADQLDSANNSDWAINNNAPASSDPANTAFVIRRFDDTQQEGAGWFYTIPSGTTSLIFGIKARRLATSGGSQNVILKLYSRQLPNNSAVTSWSAALQLTTLSMPNNLFFQYFSQTITLTTLGLTAGNLVQFELTRDGANGSDTLVGDWGLIEIYMEPI